MITIDSLCVRLGGQPVLDGVTMHLTTGAVHGLVGINGAGKTTLFNTAYGFIKPQSGSVTIDGQPLRRRDTAFLESTNYFYPGMTGRDYLDLVRHYHPSSDPEADVWRFGLPLDSQVEEWSDGMRKKLAITAVAMQKKQLYLLDEPFNGLDIESIYTAQQIFARLGRDNRTVIISSHILSTLDPLCDDIFLLDGGRIGTCWKRGEYGHAARELEALFRARYEARCSQK